jgi:MFS family permease
MSSDPHAPAPRYAWAIVFCSALTMLATLPGRTQGLGLITEPMLADMQVDHLAYAQINLWATLIGAAFCLPAGWLIDRWGIRLVTTVMLLATGLVTWCLSGLAGGFWPLFLVITLTRGFGQSALSVCSITSVGKWFTRENGPAMAWYAFLTSIFFATAFYYIGQGIQSWGWRLTWSVVAGTLMIVLAPVTWLLLRDGPVVKVEASAVSVSNGSSQTGLRDALSSRVFWVFGLSTACYGLASSGFGLFGEATLRELGFGPKDYYALLVSSSLVALFAQLGAGWLALHFPIGRLTGAAMLLYAIALGLLSVLQTKLMLWVCAVLLGAAGGVIVVIFFAVWSRAFGQAQLGRIQGAAQLLTVFASALGPLLFASCAKYLGSYRPALWLLIPVILCLSVAAWRIKLTKATGTNG